MKSFYIETKILLLKSLKAYNNTNTTVLLKKKKTLKVFKIVLFVRSWSDKMIPFYSITMEICSSSLEFIYLSILS